MLFLTSTGFDSLLAFNLNTREFVWGVYFSKDGRQWVAQAFDPRVQGGPAFTNSYHINMVKVNQDGIYLSGLNTQALLALSADLAVTEFCNLPKGCHNAQPFEDGVLFNDTGSDVVRYVSPNAQGCAVPVPGFDPETLEYRGVDDSRIARQGFGRGLCVVNDQLIAAGSSPSTVAIIDVSAGKRLTAVNLTLDIRNAIHGLECWPRRWA